MKFDESFKLSDVLLALDRKGHDHLGIEPGLEFSIDVVYIGSSARHSGTEVLPGESEDGDETIGHVFATMISDSFTD